MNEYNEVAAFEGFCGETIRVGDVIVYPGRSGSSIWLNRATVERILVHEYRSAFRDYTLHNWKIIAKREKGRRVTLENPRRIARVQTAHQAAAQAFREAINRAHPLSGGEHA